MAQTIKIKRGGISGLSGLSTSQGELVIVTGSLGNNANGPFLLAHGDSLGLVAGAIFTGSSVPTISDSQLNGALFYDTSANKFYRLDSGGNQELEIANTFSAADISGSFVATSASIASDIDANFTQININTTSISTNASSITALNAATSSYALIADISGAFVATSASIAADIATNVGNISGNQTDIATNATEIDNLTAATSSYALIADISGAFVATSASIASDIAAINNYTATDISGAFVATSASIASDIATNVVNINDNSNAIGILQGNPVFSATDISGSFTLTSASIAADIAGLESTNFTAADISGSFTLTSASIASDIAALPTTADLDGLVSASNGVDNRVAVFTGPDGIEGDGDLTWDGTTFTITGDLSVSGTTTTVNSTEVNIGDRIITLNSANSAGDGGIYVNDADAPFTTGSLLYKSTAGYWTIGSVGGTNNRIVEFDSVAPTNNGFLHLNGDKEVVSVAQGSAGSILQSDGDGTFTVTNVIDGGTF